MKFLIGNLEILKTFIWLSPLLTNFRFQAQVLCADLSCCVKRRLVGTNLNHWKCAPTPPRTTSTPPPPPYCWIIPLSQAEAKKFKLKRHYQYLGDLSQENDKFESCWAEQNLFNFTEKKSCIWILKEEKKTIWTETCRKIKFFRLSFSIWRLNSASVVISFWIVVK